MTGCLLAGVGLSYLLAISVHHLTACSIAVAFYNSIDRKAKVSEVQASLHKFAILARQHMLPALEDHLGYIFSFMDVPTEANKRKVRNGPQILDVRSPVLWNLVRHQVFPLKHGS